MGDSDGYLVTKGMPPAGAFSYLRQEDRSSWPIKDVVRLGSLVIAWITTEPAVIVACSSACDSSAG